MDNGFILTYPVLPNRLFIMICFFNTYEVKWNFPESMACSIVIDYVKQCSCTVLCSVQNLDLLSGKSCIDKRDHTIHSCGLCVFIIDIFCAIKYFNKYAHSEVQVLIIRTILIRLASKTYKS